MKLYETLEKQLKKENNFITDNGELKKWVVINKAQNFDAGVIELLLENKELKEKFFIEVKGTLVFNQNLFLQFLEQKNYLNDSYTQYKNKVGLTIDGKYLKQKNEVALVWPFKDCVLEGGQSREEDKREEIFFNEILAQDEITQLLEPKVLTNAKTYNKDGEHDYKGFTRDGELNKKRGLPQNTITDNLIIKGNNLLALHSLKKEFAGKVKLIYIDPPYNTGGDGFKYNDRFNHSTWLTFMKNRLEIAKDLLLNNGSIWISIDTNEQAYLKILCDSIFGRQNLVGQVSVAKGTTTGQDAKMLGSSIDYLIIYAKNIEQFEVNGVPLTENDLTRFSEEDDRGAYSTLQFRKTGNGDKRKDRPNLYFSINGPDGKEVYPIGPGGYESRWRADEKKFKNWLENDYVVWKLRDKAYVPYIKYYAENRTKSVSNLWNDIEGNKKATITLKGLFKGKNVFQNPKPVGLIKKIIQVGGVENGDIILDFHAGSGTTGQAVLDINMEDGEQRQFILCEQMEYTENLTAERVKKVIKKNKQGSFTYLELKKYNQSFIEQIEEAKDSKALLKIWEQMKEKSFLNYNVDLQKQDEHIEEFKQLEIKQQKEHLFKLLDKNQLYVNLPSINDKDFKVSKEEKQLTQEFYQIKG